MAKKKNRQVVRKSDLMDVDNWDDTDKIVFAKMVGGYPNLSWEKLAKANDIAVSTIYWRKDRMARSQYFRQEIVPYLRGGGAVGEVLNNMRTLSLKNPEAGKVILELAKVWERKPQVQVQTNVINVSQEQLEEQMERIKQRRLRHQETGKE